MALTLLPPSAGIHLSLNPLRADVINGWPLGEALQGISQKIFGGIFGFGGLYIEFGPIFIEFRFLTVKKFHFEGVEPV